MLVFLIKRLIQSLLALVVVVTIVFLLGRVMGDPVALLLPDDPTIEELERLTRQLGLDRPIHVQYFEYMGDLVQGKLGTSILLKGYSVSEVLRPAMYNSAKLAGFAFGLSLITGIPLGVLAAVKRNTPWDYGARLMAMFGQVVPGWWLGIIFILLFSVAWDVLPPAGIGSFPLHYIMPGVVIATFGTAAMTRLVRSSMLEVLDSEYVKLARAKGVPWHSVLFKHALRNALIPLVTYGGLLFAALITGAIVVEVVFAWPGLGRVMFDALSTRDFPIMQGAILLGATFVVFFNFLVDLLYGLIDPRIRVH